MKDILTVFSFTLRDGLRKKAFQLTTILVLVLIVVACLIPRLIHSDGDTPPVEETPAGDSSGDYSQFCYLIDESGLVPGLQEALAAADPSTDFRTGQSGQLESYQEEIEKDKNITAAVILPGEAGGLPKVIFYASDFLNSGPMETVKAMIKMVYVSHLLTEAGLPAGTAQLALGEVETELQMVNKMDLSGYLIGIVLIMIIFFAVYYYGYSVAMSVASEKTSRVMETLIVSAKPSRILLGKCLAMGVLGLLQLSLFLIAGGVCFTLIVPDGFTIGGMPLALSSFTPLSALLILVYFILGFALYAMLNSVCGATVSRIEDLNSAMMPAVLISMLSFYFAYFPLIMPGSSVSRITTLVPLTAPFVMPFRLLNETVPTADILLSILFLLIAIVLIAAVSIRLYSASVLHYGERLKLKDLFRLKS